jgi:hypothetical protein
MRSHLNMYDVVVGDAPSILPRAESSFTRDSRNLWVYHPQDFLRRPFAESDGYRDPVAGIRAFLPHRCQGETSMQTNCAVVPYPGHSLFQESFFFCTIKNVGDDPGAGDIYVETAVDGNSRMAFAKIYSARNAMNAVDLLASRVAPFFKDHGVAIERIFTPKSNEFCGLAPVHPYETILATSQIQHLQLDRPSLVAKSPCEEFFHVLQREFFTPGLRKKFQQSLASLQNDLDAFVEAYNSLRTDFGTDELGRPPLRAFLDAANS